MYRIKLEQFEGPLDLLLNLIEEQKLDVTRVSLAKVADQYLKYMEKQENVSLGNLADFLSVASKLLLIKSKALLPILELSEEEEKEIKDLEWQLAEFKKFKEISKSLGQMYHSERLSYAREGYYGIGSFFYPPPNFSIFDLEKNFKRILEEIPIIEELEQEVVKEVMTLEEKVRHVQEMLKEKMEMAFSELTSEAKDKIEVIISFLALLELVKQRIVHVEQDKLFEDIRLKKPESKGEEE
jgi:segregation and condensation protein A